MWQKRLHISNLSQNQWEGGTKSWQEKKNKQAEAEVVPSSSSVKFNFLKFS